ncbi:glycogen synthase [Catellatospora chokoriensis]|uniref:Transferase n=1 Tax=Catellatospora chokoriensis TaxID=310353 RepID=A0A8J3KGK5_9ACTN|nr:transferase [Catellatospora chokoriensis]
MRPDGSLRVLLVSTPPEIGGGERYVEQLVKHLPAQFALSTQHKGFRALASAWGIPAWHLFGSIKLHGIWHLRLFTMLLPLYWLQYLVLFLRWRPDVVHVQSNEEKISVALPARLFRIPVIWTMHGPVDVSGSRLYARLFKQAAAHAQAVICVSDFARRSFLETGASPREVVVIHNGVDLSVYEFGHRTGRYVTFLGRLEEIKNPKLFVESCIAVAADHPDARFRIIGSGTLEDGLKDVVKQAGLERSFRFEGWIEDPLPLLLEASVLAMTSEIEGLPLAAVEAMAVGVPVVATAVGGLVEVIDDGSTGILCQPRNVESVSAGIASVLSDGRLAQQLARSARSKVEARFSLAGMIADTRQAYERAAGA